jgi:hypothetical protein
MPDTNLTLESRGIEIIKQALIWYYRAWSFYWLEEPRACSIYAAESFVACEEEVICFVPRRVTRDDVDRLLTIFGQRISFIADAFPGDQSGYCIAQGRFEKATLLLRRVVNQIRRDYDLLGDEISIRRKEKRRQEWILGQAGRYSEYSDGFHKSLMLTPREGASYAYSLIVNRPGEWRFSNAPPEGMGAPISHGGYRRHWNEVGRQSLECLDLFPDSDRPRLWRLARVGTGFKITRRETPSPATICDEFTPQLEEGSHLRDQ